MFWEFGDLSHFLKDPKKRTDYSERHWQSVWAIEFIWILNLFMLLSYQVFDILKHMPRVKFVNLSFNNLTEELVNVDNRNPFPYLKNLVLNATRINWKSVRDLLRLLPRFVSFLHNNLSLKSCLLFGSKLQGHSHVCECITFIIWIKSLRQIHPWVSKSVI